MCGIAGVLRFDGRPVNEQALRRLGERIAHRGPDDVGTLVGPSVGLAHRRLSILDLSAAAHQPMWDPGRRAAICYNGEVYNYKDLRSRLAREGHAFRSAGDTEVLLQACRAWGVPEAARRADGMFAFAYWDETRRELWLARDRTGIKPLYYHRLPERVLFASEIKALLGEVEPQLEEHVLLALLMGLPLHGPQTLFQGIRAVEAGRAVCIRAGGHWESHTFFSLAEAVDEGLYHALDRMPDEHVISTVAGLVDRSAELHLASEAPVAALCSGGLDSSLLASLVKQRLPGLVAYHAHVGGPFSELEWARAFARHAGLPLRAAELTPQGYVRALAAVTYANECPVGLHPNTVPFYLVCRLAAQDGVKVLLMGEGADELFGGYAAFRYYTRRRRFDRWKGRLVRALSWVGLGRWGRILDRLTDSEGHYGMRSRAAALLTRGRSLLPIREAQDVYGFIADPVEREFHADLFGYLHGYLQSILWRNDRMGMAVGLENRVPYLENELIRHAVNLPMRFKLRGRVDKWALRRVADRHLPPALSGRAKVGFPVDAASYLRPAPGFFRHGFLETRLEVGPPQLGALAESSPDALFHLVAAEVWGQLFFQGAAADDVTERLLASCPTICAGPAAATPAPGPDGVLLA
jgi:asparagine synthase (glutamine-hydrolysing)